MPLTGPVKGPQPTALSSYGQPVRFLDYLIADPVETVLLAGGGVMARVPGPARFALHKLIVSQRRTPVEGARQRKDLDQAGQLLHALVEDNADRLIEAYKELIARGPSWKKALRSGLSSLPDPDLRSAVKALFEEQ